MTPRANKASIAVVANSRGPSVIETPRLAAERRHSTVIGNRLIFANWLPIDFHAGVASSRNSKPSPKHAPEPLVFLIIPLTRAALRHWTAIRWEVSEICHSRLLVLPSSLLIHSDKFRMIFANTCSSSTEISLRVFWMMCCRVWIARSFVFKIRERILLDIPIESLSFELKDFETITILIGRTFNPKSWETTISLEVLINS
mmetsp:Transcript_23847/g.31178  ORF Transcript_23847/g.31178 Transcript_23847/m.31178 type:complete len:201 (-) Transcript_23847:223-825(-)